ncbi:MAG: hypothetical protein ACRDRT_02465, partial [Pseudonocardiaceae bacterium]
VRRADGQLRRERPAAVLCCPPHDDRLTTLIVITADRNDGDPRSGAGPSITVAGAVGEEVGDLLDEPRRDKALAHVRGCAALRRSGPIGHATRVPIRLILPCTSVNKVFAAEGRD